MKQNTHFAYLAGLAALFSSCQNYNAGINNSQSDSLILNKISGAKPRNIIYILSDDHRYDAMSFMGKYPDIRTPTLDAFAKNGVHCQNTFVGTALSSPSRASVLTGLYTHEHKIVDNSSPAPINNIYFPQYLQKAGYQTAFFGKWHMGNDSDAPQRGFDRWVSFRGQGEYYGHTINIDNKQVNLADTSYISNVLTNYAIDFLKNRNKEKPFFVYLSHKAVHAMFKPSKKFEGSQKNMKIKYPISMNLTKTDEYKKYGMPEWQKKQRNSWHGVDYLYDGQISFDDFLKQYCETLESMDETINELVSYLKKEGLYESTVIMYMGDNGFSFGEHGLIDKRHAYEESMRVPLLVQCPELFKAGTNITQMIENVDIAPTILELAGLESPKYLSGKSFLPLLQGKQVQNWRDKIHYEYYWEYAYPQTPTIFAVRSERYKYIFNYGIWDTNEFYDLQADPQEMNNLIKSPDHQIAIKAMRDELWSWLEKTKGMNIPLKEPVGKRIDHLNKGTY